jgi:L-lactate utilization protein LutB
MGLRIIDRVNQKTLRQAAEARERLINDEALHWGEALGLESELAKENFRSKIASVKSSTLQGFNEIIEQVDEQIKSSGAVGCRVQSQIDIERILDLLDGTAIDSEIARGL